MSTREEVPKTQVIKDLEALAQHPRTPKRVGNVASGVARGLHAARRPSYRLRLHADALAERSKAFHERSSQGLDAELAAFELDLVISHRLKDARRGRGPELSEPEALEAILEKRRSDPQAFRQLGLDQLAYTQHVAEGLEESGVKKRDAYEQVYAARRGDLAGFLTSAEAWADEQTQPIEAVSPE